jgi:hypothetical protein
MSLLLISRSGMTRYAIGMNFTPCLFRARAHAMCSIHKWAASDSQMKRYFPTSGGGSYGGLRQTAASAAGLNLLDEYDNGITTIQKWQNL